MMNPNDRVYAEVMLKNAINELDTLFDRPQRGKPEKFLRD